ncbi:unnamed protein product [Polarella glacialis]|uniref:Hexosyltransferase n=1 Tax=Polarella glacialis TaxID=89957 RepID=A0A813DL53_POLGL|nr:unnamed protein product [Polarella glacialis]
MKTTTWALLGLTCVVAIAVFLTSRQLHLHADASQHLQPANVVAPIHICLCSDDSDLRAAAVAMRSAYINAREPQRLVFHFVTTTELAPIAKVNLEVHHDTPSMQQLHAQLAIRGGSSSGAEISVFQFVPYFLQDFVKLRKVSLASRIATASRVIYLSTDTITLGDIGSLNALNLNGMAVATVKSCSLRLRNIIDFDKLEILKLRDKHLRPDDCIANNALMVIDLVKWKMQNISGKMLDWHNHSNQQSQEDELWTGGDIVLPAFLLALSSDLSCCYCYCCCG